MIRTFTQVLSLIDLRWLQLFARLMSPTSSTLHELKSTDSNDRQLLAMCIKAEVVILGHAERQSDRNDGHCSVKLANTSFVIFLHSERSSADREWKFEVPNKLEYMEALV